MKIPVLTMTILNFVAYFLVSFSILGNNIFMELKIRWRETIDSNHQLMFNARKNILLSKHHCIFEILFSIYKFPSFKINHMHNEVKKTEVITHDSIGFEWDFSILFIL